jgi:hypothetical protein
MVVQHGIAGVAVAGQQWQAVVGRESVRGSGGCATALLGRQQLNACKVVLLEREGGGGCAAVMVRRRRGLSGREG